jgi:hypothetical protein
VFVLGEIGPQPRSRRDLFCSLLICIIDAGSNTKVRAAPPSLRAYKRAAIFCFTLCSGMDPYMTWERSPRDLVRGWGNSGAEMYLRPMDCIKFLREWAIMRLLTDTFFTEPAQENLKRIENVNIYD